MQTGRNSRNGCLWRYILSYQCTCSDKGPVSDCDSPKDYDSGTDGDIVLHLSSNYVPVFFILGFAIGISGSGKKVVNEHYAVPDEHAVTNSHAFTNECVG